MSTGQDPTPVHSQGFGPAESADETRQAQHTQANDTPTDVAGYGGLAALGLWLFARSEETAEPLK